MLYFIYFFFFTLFAIYTYKYFFFCFVLLLLCFCLILFIDIRPHILVIYEFICIYIYLYIFMSRQKLWHAFFYLFLKFSFVLQCNVSCPDVMHTCVTRFRQLFSRIYIYTFKQYYTWI